MIESQPAKRMLVQHVDACIWCGQCERYCPTGQGIQLTSEYIEIGFKPEDFEERVEKELLLCEICGERSCPGGSVPLAGPSTWSARIYKSHPDANGWEGSWHCRAARQDRGRDGAARRSSPYSVSQMPPGNRLACVIRDQKKDERKTMTKTATYALNVNLSASQTRKRLKGYGFGVKKVQATDRNQSVIVHTATREHLQELESLFADVMTSPPKDELDTAVEDMRNIESHNDKHESA